MCRPSYISHLSIIQCITFYSEQFQSLNGFYLRLPSSWSAVLQVLPLLNATSIRFSPWWNKAQQRQSSSQIFVFPSYNLELCPISARSLMLCSSETKYLLALILTLVLQTTCLTQLLKHGILQSQARFVFSCMKNLRRAWGQSQHWCTG